MVVLETACRNSTDVSGYCRKRALFPCQPAFWRLAAQDSKAKLLLTMTEQKVLEKRYQADQQELKRLLEWKLRP